MKKLLPLFLVFLLFFSFFLRPKPSYAIGVDTALKLAAGSEGEMVLDGIAERAGIEFADKTAAQKALERWNWDLQNVNDADIKARMSNFVSTVNSAPKTPMPDAPGWSKVVISSAMFLTGADLIYNGYKSFKNAYDSQKFASVMADNFASGNSYSSGSGMYFDWFASGGSGVNAVKQWALYNSHNKTLAQPYQTGSVKVGTEFNYFTVTSENATTIFLTAYLSGTTIGGSFWSQSYDTSDSLANLTSDMITEVFQPSADEVPDISKMNPDVTPLISNDGIDPLPATNPLPDSIEIAIPDSGVYPTPDTATEPSPNADVVGDATTDTGSLTDPVTDPGSGDDSDTTGDDPKSNPDDTAHKFGQLITSKFPFSLPWDVAALVGVLNATPVKPEVHIDKTYSFLGHSYNFKLDYTFDVFDKYVPFFRTFILISFVIFLITKTRSLFGGGQ